MRKATALVIGVMLLTVATLLPTSPVTAAISPDQYADIQEEEAMNTGRTPFELRGDLEGPEWKLSMYPSPHPYSLAMGPDGTIYVAGGQYGLQAIEPRSGVKWTFYAPSAGGTPWISNQNVIYFTTSSYWSPYEGGALYAVDHDGRMLWLLPLPGTGSMTGPVMDDSGTIYLTAGDQDGYFLMAVNQNGTFEWMVDLEGIGGGRPAITPDGSIVVVASSIYKIWPNGTVQWRMPDAVTGPVVGADGMIYSGSEDGHLTAYRPDGSVAWTYGEQYGYHSPAAVSNGSVYVVRDARSLLALSADGQLQWSYPFPDYVRSGVVVTADGELAICRGNEALEMSVLSSEGDLLRTAHVSETFHDYVASMVVTTDGSICLATSDSLIQLGRPPLLTVQAIEAMVLIALLIGMAFVFFRSRTWGRGK